MPQPEPLPIDAVLPDVLRAVRERGAVVLEAEPGAGKTTRVPPALLGAVTGEILVSEPRRLAARLAAERVAEERGERVGETVGYSIRFEDVGGPRTRVRFVTDGVLLRRLLDDPELTGVGAVVLDELHERHLASDVALALLARLRRTSRPDLAVVATSATLDAEPVAAFLGAERLRSEGRRFDVSVEHLPRPDDRALELAVTSAVKDLVRADAEGHVLVFLPGAAEIRRGLVALESFARELGLEVLPLHGDLPVAEQARVVRPAARRRVILSTNVAESSVTVPGVTGVVDSGLARVATCSPWTGLPRLSLEKVSRASATQRAGRAGRTRPGRVLRLYTRGDFEARPEHDAPEIRREELSDVLLLLLGSGRGRPEDLAWLEAPPAAALAAARTLLASLGALRGDDLTPVGRRLLRFPVHARLARLVVEGEHRGVARDACLVAALLGERDIRRAARTRFGERGGIDAAGRSDLVELVERFREAEHARFRDAALRAADLDARSVRAVDRMRRQLERLARHDADGPGSSEEAETALGLSVLAAFPDRVARRRRPGERALVLAGGESATLGDTSIVHEGELLVAVDVEERGAAPLRGPTRVGGAVVRLAQTIEPEWLLEVAGDALRHEDTFEWNATSERVERVARTTYGAVVVDETRRAAAPGPAAGAVLARAALARGAHTFAAGDELHGLVERVAFLSRVAPELDLPDFTDGPRRAIEAAAASRTTFSELESADLATELLSSLSPEQSRRLREWAPERLRLSGGREVSVSYAAGKDPFIASRLQDFFGSAAGPRIAGGRTAVTLHLLAPNHRAVQVTTDLAGFWERHYPSIRRELMRRYPRHAWPEDGRTAKPPEPRPRRPR